MTHYVNGAFVDAAMIDASDRGLLLGDGAFETMLASGARAAFVEAHVARLSRGLAALGIAVPPDLARLDAIIAGIAARNSLTPRSAVRVTVTRGAGPRGLSLPAEGETRPTVLVSMSAYQPPSAPARLAVSRQRKFSGATTASFKCIGGYTENILALAEAQQSGADDAVLLNERGLVVGASAANIFMIDPSSAIATPPLAEGATPGVVRALLIEGARALGMGMSERALGPEDLGGQFLFLSNSLVGLRAATLGGATPGDRGESFRALQTWYARRLAASLDAGPPEADRR